MPPAHGGATTRTEEAVDLRGDPVASAQAKTLGEREIEMIRDALAAAGGNISEASKRLGISRNTIYRKLRWNQP
jgi:transcriptional regulator of acetoin/glycerol metabolism